MIAKSAAFSYDDFEQYLLDSARHDRAPSDLPARLGIALQLGVPIVVATEAASLLPTTTTLSGVGAAPLGNTGVPSGFVAAIKSAFGTSASTLFGTAAKGIAVGLLSGGMALGTGHAVYRMTQPNAAKALVAPKLAPMHSATLGTQLRTTGSASREAASASELPKTDESSAAATNGAELAAAAPVAIPNRGASAPVVRRAPVSPLPRATQRASAPAMVNIPPMGTGRPSSAAQAGLGRDVLGTAPVTVGAKAVARLPIAVVPEKTTAVARYPSLGEEIGAVAEAPKKVTVPEPTPVAAVEPMIDPTQLLIMRNRTLQRSRTLLGQSKAALALTELDSFRLYVGERNFGVDELLLRIEALATLGRATEAQVDVINVERLAPNSAALRQAQLLARSRFVR